MENLLINYLPYLNYNKIISRNEEKWMIMQLAKIKGEYGYETRINYSVLHSIRDEPAYKSDWGLYVGWYKYGKLHRDGDLPAYFFNMDEMWYNNGKRHSDGDKPAVITWRNGGKEWWKDGLRHREGDKPAVELSDGRKEWWVNGKRLEK